MSLVFSVNGLVLENFDADHIPTQQELAPLFQEVQARHPAYPMYLVNLSA